MSRRGFNEDDLDTAGLGDESLQLLNHDDWLRRGDRGAFMLCHCSWQLRCAGCENKIRAHVGVALDGL